MTRRLPTNDLPDELAGLVLTFNAALARLQRSYVQLSTFNSDVAHELRTPLGNLIGETEVALTRRRSSDDLAAVLRSNLEELARLRSIVNDMLFLARADQGDVAANLVEVSLAQECRRTADFMEVLFDEAGIELRIEGEARTRIERSLFGRALTNLLDNAIRHGAPGIVTIVLEERERDVVVTVQSPGPPIDDDKVSRIFDRFYRTDPSRTRSVDSHGLGLAIVSAVAQMHGGTVFARRGAEVNEIGLTIARQVYAGTTPDRPASTMNVRNVLTVAPGSRGSEIA
jgi:two-component system heavy metal sensor histidine kinase CusS